METKQFAKASADFQAAIKHSPKNPKAHFGACAAALSLNQFQEAVNACSEVLKLERSGDAAHYRAQAHLALKNVDAAIADLRLSTQIKLDAPDAFFQLGQIYQQNGDLVNALNSYTRAIQQKGTYADAYKARAQIRSYLGDTAGSSDDTTRAAASLKR
jgi:tetratricopeptide (TPR) repeat protein